MIGKYRCMELDCRRWLEIKEPGVTPDHYSPMTDMRCPASGEGVLCPTPHKSSFADEREARTFARQLRPRTSSVRKQAPYLCICGLTHLRTDKSQ